MGSSSCSTGGTADADGPKDYERSLRAFEHAHTAAAEQLARDLSAKLRAIRLLEFDCSDNNIFAVTSPIPVPLTVMSSARHTAIRHVASAWLVGGEPKRQPGRVAKRVSTGRSSFPVSMRRFPGSSLVARRSSLILVRDYLVVTRRKR
jgi:hypothetical protein